MSVRHGEAFTAQDILRYCAVPRLRNVYMLGARERRVTIKSQQVRALNLIWALHHTGRLQRGTVAIIGGGFAGLTAAAAAIRLHANVILFERETEFVSLQDRCDHRRVHPSLFDWPEDDSITPDAGLPVLNWVAGTAGEVREQILEAWKEFAPRMMSCPPTHVHAVNADGSVEFERGGESGLERYSNVIIAVGMGLEVDHGSPTQSYWRADGLEQYFSMGKRGQPTEVVIVGNGDGGIVDVLRAALGVRKPPLLEWFEQEVLPLVPRSLRQDLVKVERELAVVEPSRASDFLEDRYGDLLLGGLQELQDVVEPRKRKDTFVRLIGKTATPFSRDATALNRFLLALLIRCDPGGVLFKYDIHEPMVDERIKVVHQRFEQQAHLDAEMRRRGPLGYGHYAFLTARDARQHAPWLLGDAAAKRCNVACLALPIMDPIDWKLISTMPGPLPEEQVARWNADSDRPARTCHTSVEQDGETSQIYCFYDEQVGAPWPQGGAQ